MNAVGISLHSSSEHGLSQFRNLAFSCGVNIGSRARSVRFESLASSPSLRPGSSSAFYSPPSSSVRPITGRRRWNRFQVPNRLHCPSVDLAFQFCHFAVPPRIRILMRPPPTPTHSYEFNKGRSICPTLSRAALSNPHKYRPLLTSFWGYLSALLLYLSAILLVYPTYPLSLLPLVYTSRDIYTHAIAFVE